MPLDFEVGPSDSYENSIPLETRIPTGKREKVKRHMAEQAFLGDFLPLIEPDGIWEDLREHLKEKISDQSEAIDALVSVMDRWDVRTEKDNRPVATLAFLGPTGVGKTETAQVLSEYLRRAPGKLVKIDCTNFSQGHEIASLVGSPPGYKDHDQEPFLSKKKIEKPGTVILFDEIEKGAPELFDLMLPILEDGTLQLNNGEVVNFRECIIILTSNLGAKDLQAEINKYPMGFGDREIETDTKVLNSKALKAFKEYFKPEFINRIDELVVFHPLSREGLARVLLSKLDELSQFYEDEFGVRISLTEATIGYLVAIAQKEPELGARPLVRAFKAHIQATFGKYIASGSVPEGTHVRIFHREEFPEDYQHPGDKELIFASKHDARIKKKVEPSKELALLPPPPTEPEYDVDIDEKMRAFADEDIPGKEEV
jgi:ATP-dependent Clp protease ATP-binding subunit ClpA